MFYRGKNLLLCLVFPSVVASLVKGPLQIPWHLMLKRSAGWRQHVSNTAYPKEGVSALPHLLGGRPRVFISTPDVQLLAHPPVCIEYLCNPGRGVYTEDTMNKPGLWPLGASGLWSNSHSRGRWSGSHESIDGVTSKDLGFRKGLVWIGEKCFVLSFICPVPCRSAMLSCCWGKMEWVRVRMWLTTCC